MCAKRASYNNNKNNKLQPHEAWVVASQLCIYCCWLLALAIRATFCIFFSHRPSANGISNLCSIIYHRVYYPCSVSEVMLGRLLAFMPSQLLFSFTSVCFSSFLSDSICCFFFAFFFFLSFFSLVDFYFIFGTFMIFTNTINIKKITNIRIGIASWRGSTLVGWLGVLN